MGYIVPARMPLRARAGQAGAGRRCMADVDDMYRTMVCCNVVVNGKVGGGFAVAVHISIYGYIRHAGMIVMYM